MESGRENDTRGMITPGQVSNRWKLRHRLNSGLIKDTTGKAAMARATDRINLLPGNSSRAMPYAAKVANTTLIRVEMATMPIELRSALVKRLVLKTVL